MSRDLDVVVFGATGDTGAIGYAYLYFHGRRLGFSKWAPAARNLKKLKTDVLDRFEGVAPGPNGLLPSDPIQADSGDFESLLRMCERTKCVVACAGPFTSFGEGVVRACVEAGTHYVDITGETPWVEKMYRRYGLQAEEKGVSIVPLSGYDSIPSDLSTNLAAKFFEKDGDQLQRFENFMGVAGGASPSGTIETVIEAVDANKYKFSCGLLGTAPKLKVHNVHTEAALKKSERRDRSLLPKTEMQSKTKSLIWSCIPGYSWLAGHFCVPFFMAPINVVSVHITAAKEGYGGIAYRERFGGLPKGFLSLFGLIPTLVSILLTVGFVLLLPLPGVTTLIRKIRDIFNTPLKHKTRTQLFNQYSPSGKVSVRGFGFSKYGKKVIVKMNSDYDAGLGFTLISACTVASELVKGNSKKPGFNTPVLALGGEQLVEALRDSGVVIKVEVL